MASELLLRDCSWVVTQDPKRRILRETSVLVEGSRIAEVGRNLSSKGEVLECRGKILMPGLVNTHTHVSMTLLRGYADDMELQEWLSKKIWPAEAKLTGKMCYDAALLGCMEMIRTGTTSFLDMYFHMEDVAKAVQKGGLRSVLSHGIIDTGSEEKAKKDRKATEQFHSFVKSLDDERVRFAVGPHAPYTCSDETLRWSREFAEKHDCPVNIHLAETRREQAEFETKRHTREVEYLDKIGFLCPNVIAAHAVWLTKPEVKTLADRGVSVAHCPVSNMKLAGGGAAPLPEMFDYGVKVGLGTDGAASNNSLDMFETMKVCALLHKHARWDATVLPAQQVLDLATVDGARLLGIDDRLGTVESGSIADMVTLPADSPRLAPLDGEQSIVSGLVYSASGLNVETSIVNGQVLMHHGKFRELNEKEVYEKVLEDRRTLLAQVS